MIKTVRFLSLLLLVVALFLCSSEALAKTDEPGKAQKTKVMEAYGKLPLYFIQNDGQADERVKFYEKGSGHATFFTKEGVYLSLRKGEQPSASSHQPEIENSKLKTQNSELVRLIPLNANKNPEIVAEEKLSGKVNYFTGNDPKKWRTDIPTYTKVRYKEVYPGIDMVFYGNQRQLEYDVVVKPGADPSIAAFEYEGVKELKVNKEGELEITLKAPSPLAGEGRGEGDKIIQKKPYIYQEIEGRKVAIEGSFNVKGNTYSFKVKNYHKDYALVIDPVLSYSTYLGGSIDDFGIGIAVDSSGSAYVTGYTWATDFPTENPYQGSKAGYPDVFITKLSPSGDSLIYATYLGGSDWDYGNGIAVDTSGSAYVTGYTYSNDFPTENPYQGSRGNIDAFVTKLSPSGDSLIYSTYLGGSSGDYGYGIAVDTSGNAYVTGYTWSSNFPTENPYQGSNAGSSDVFVTKLSPSGESLIYSTYLGGSDWDFGFDIAVDTSGSAYVTGYTWSSNFPTENPYQGSNAGSSDVFVTKLSPSGDSLIYSTYLGGSDWDSGRGIAVDSSGNAYVTGYTWSSNFPTENPYDLTCGTDGICNGGYSDAFVTKINSSGNSLIYSTYLGGSDWDSGRGIAVDSSGNAYVTGYTWSSNFPTENPYQGSNAGLIDVFVTKLSPEGNSLIYSTYIGGSGGDYCFGIAVDSSGNAYVTGYTYSNDFPTENPYQGSLGGNIDAFVTKLSDLPDLIVSSLSAGIRTYGTPMVRGVFANYMVTNQGSGDAVASCLDFYLSRDTVLGAGDVYVGRENIPGLTAGNSYGRSIGFRLSSDKWQPASGTWRVIADADACDDNDESDETNNQTSTVAGITAK